MTDGKITKTEFYNIEKLEYIIKNSKQLCIEQEHIDVAKAYLKKELTIDKGVKIKYIQRKGRFYAQGPSLQSLPRKIRHTIAKDMYDDIDMVNAGPVILQQMCKDSKYKCKHLTTYVQNREVIFESMKISRDDSKKIFNNLTFGGPLSDEANPFMQNYSKELKLIHKQFAKDNKVEFKEFKQARIDDQKTYNHESAFTSMLINTNENKILQCIYKFFGKPKNVSFAFDGLLIEKSNANYKVLIPECELDIFKHTGIAMKLKVKQMDEGYNIIENNDVVGEIEGSDDVEEIEEIEEIEEVIPKKKPKIKNVDNQTIAIELIDGGHVAIADFVKVHVHDKFVCSIAKTYELFYFDGIKWILDAGSTIFFRYMTTTIKKKICSLSSILYESGKKDAIDIAGNLHSVIKKLGSNTFLKDVSQCFARIVYDKHFLGKLDNNVDLLGFDNGTYDLIKKEFRTARSDDYITQTVGYDFPVKSHGYDEDIKDFLNKVFPDEEVRQYVITQQSQALSGRLGKHLIHTHTGYGGNGKSIETEILSRTFGQYALKIDIGMLTVKRQSFTNADPFTLQLKGARYVFASEPREGDTLNVGVMKDMSGGETVKARQLFSGVVEEFKPQNHIHIYCNEKLAFDGADGGAARRMKTIDYPSKFDDAKFVNEDQGIYLIDYNLSDKVADWKQDYMRMLLDIYDVNYKYTCPKSIEDASAEYLDSNNDVKQFVIDNLEKTNNKTDFVRLVDMKALYKSNKEYNICKLKDLKKSLEKELQTPCKERHGAGGKDRKVYIGWKQIEDENNDNDQ
jgi:P4 family phage/plasmid primase-like protien